MRSVKLEIEAFKLDLLIFVHQIYFMIFKYC